MLQLPDRLMGQGVANQEVLHHGLQRLKAVCPVQWRRVLTRGTEVPQLRLGRLAEHAQPLWPGTPLPRSPAALPDLFLHSSVPDPAGLVA